MHPFITKKLGNFIFKGLSYTECMRLTLFQNKGLVLPENVTSMYRLLDTTAAEQGMVRP